MIIPHAENADVDIRKLYNYSLNTAHRVGQSFLDTDTEERGFFWGADSKEHWFP